MNKSSSVFVLQVVVTVHSLFLLLGTYRRQKLESIEIKNLFFGRRELTDIFFLLRVTFSRTNARNNINLKNNSPINNPVAFESIHSKKHELE